MHYYILQNNNNNNNNNNNSSSSGRMYLMCVVVNHLSGKVPDVVGDFLRLVLYGPVADVYAVGDVLPHVTRVHPVVRVVVTAPALATQA